MTAAATSVVLVARYYSFEEICRVADCVEIAKACGLTVSRENRCAATWRGGTNETSVHLAFEGWHDFGTGDSGSVIDLVARVMFGGDMQRAQQWLGDRLALSPAMSVGADKTTRVERLERDGYVKVAEYPYVDPATGAARHVVERWQHPERGKEFVQRAGSRYSVKGVRTLLYRMPEWTGKAWVCICEGEKDADTVLDQLKFPATTNPSGAGNWEEHYNEWLAGKHVVIFVDNDNAGRTRRDYLLFTLKGVVGKIKVVEFPDMPEGADITDFVEAHGVEAARALVMGAEDIDKDAIRKPCSDLPAITAAKEANREELRNFILLKSTDEKGKEKITPQPRHINDLARDVRTRLLGFPCRLGDQLFDLGRDSGAISWLYSPSDLFSWLASKTGRNVQWKRGDGYTTKEEMFAALRQSAREYGCISYMPHFPTRGDTFYAHPPLPPASPDREHLSKFISFFRPINEANAILLKAFFAAPLFFVRHIPRPAWIIDSEDGFGTGKTAIAEAAALLYDSEAIRTDQDEITHRLDEVRKRIMSASGRSRKIFLLDNVEGVFSCRAYSDMITASSLSGRPTYGRGEETRWNDLVFVVTANSATVDNDIASRSFHIFISQADYSDTWKTRLVEYVTTNRYAILADILADLTTNPPFPDIRPSTRFPEFETRILQPLCGDIGEYSEVIKAIATARSVANADEEMAAVIQDKLRHNLMALCLDPDKATVFIHSIVLDRWFCETLSPRRRVDTKQLIRNLSRHGMLPDVDRKISVYPSNGTTRRRGILWGRGRTEPTIVGIRQDQTIGIMA